MGQNERPTCTFRVRPTMLGAGITIDLVPGHEDDFAAMLDDTRWAEAHDLAAAIRNELEAQDRG